MSEKRSWDVQPKRKASVRVAPAPARVASDRVRPATHARGSRLRERRRRARKTGTILLAVCLFVLTCALLYAVWLPQLRVQDVAAEGPRAEEIIQLARDSMSGTYAFILPRDSIFFFSKDAIRKHVLAAYPEIAALSLARTSFTSIQLTATPRAQAFLWCGVASDAALPEGRCFDTDAEGLVFKEAAVGDTVVLTTGSTTPSTPGDLRIFSPLDQQPAPGESPIGAHVVSASRIPDALRLVKAIRGLGVPIASLEIRGDEADLWLTGPTRITYVLGREEEAVQLAASVLPTLTLTDGSIEYVDLRFNGKAYVKRYGE